MNGTPFFTIVTKRSADPTEDMHKLRWRDLMAAMASGAVGHRFLLQRLLPTRFRCQTYGRHGLKRRSSRPSRGMNHAQSRVTALSFYVAAELIRPGRD